MLTALITWLSTAFGLWLTTRIVKGIEIASTSTLFWSALVLGLINAFLRPLLWVLTMPLTMVTFGLFALVVNALMIMLAAAIVPGFEVKSFGSALLGALVMALIALAGIVLFMLLSGASISWYSVEQHVIY